MHKKKLDTDEDTDGNDDDDDTGDEEIAKAIDVYEQDDDDDDDNSHTEGEEGEMDGHHNNSNSYCCNIQICGNIYTVDFQNMIQYPQTMPYRKRKICRAKGLPSKGVAGLLKRKRNHRMRPY